MNLIANLTLGLNILLNIPSLLAIIAGVVMGILAGAMPGLSPSMGVALLVPFTYALPPHIALVLLTAVYIASNYGGSITAVTINTPGTPASVATAMDGYPLTEKGEAKKALGFSLVSSTIGGIIGTIILIIFSIPLAKIAVKFHPAEYFALSILGLATVASLGGKDWIKAVITGIFGLFISTIGIDPISGVSRYTFNITRLYDGFSLIPVLIGLFALSGIFLQFEKFNFNTQKFEDKKGSQWPTFADYWKKKFTILRSSILGTLIGIFPGAGATIASFLSYDLAKRLSRKPDSFGKGNVEGVAAAEGANSSSVGGALVPLLTLGIPGSATTAVLIGALMIHDLDPGPRLFQNNPELIYGIFVSLLLANIVMLVLGMGGTRLWIKITEIPREILFPFIFAFAIIGSFAVRYSFFDVIICMAFGLIGWILKKFDYPVAPIVLGIVLGDLVETNFRRAVMMGGYTVFFSRIASVIMILVAVLSFIYPIIKAKRNKEGVG